MIYTSDFLPSTNFALIQWDEKDFFNPRNDFVSMQHLSSQNIGMAHFSISFIKICTFISHFAGKTILFNDKHDPKILSVKC